MRITTNKTIVFCILFLLFFLSTMPVVTQNSEKTLTIDELLKQLGNTAQLQWDPLFQSGILSFLDHRVSFFTGTAQESWYALIDGTDAVLLPAPYFEEGQLMFPEPFVAMLKDTADKSVLDTGSGFRIAAIIVDPGHGGRDPGTIGTHTINGKQTRFVEKDITLIIAQDLYKKLSLAYPDKQVLLTRSTDIYLSLQERVTLANDISLDDTEAIIFVSIHANSAFNKTARGYEVWYLDPQYRRDLVDPKKYTDSKEVIPILNAMLEEEFTRESILMAQSILKGFDETVGKDMPSRGIKAEDWFVVRNARMPSVLVELGFVSNEQDAVLMTDKNYTQHFTEALYRGIADFIVIFEQSGGFIAVD
jgi:N-acetylmuramoyl-L-alanine amidase